MREEGRFIICTIVLALALLPNAGNCGTAAARKPNFLLILVDNLGYGDVGCYGNRVIRTPFIDRLARQGVRLTSFYTASPTCTVSRACLLTGRTAQRHGLKNQLAGLKGNYGIGLNQSERLLPAYLKPLGYVTACFGKWNIGFAPGSRPTDRGFDQFFGHVSGNMDYYSHVYRGRLDLYRGTRPVEIKGYSTDLFADAACRFMRQHRSEPFFVYLPFNAPHFPSVLNKAPGQPVRWQAPAKYFRAYGLSPDEPDPVKRYRVVVTALDAAIGRVLSELDSLSLADNTLVVFFSDNGAFKLGRKGLDVGSNAPLRAGGVTLYEGGIRVPCIVRWPGHLPPGTVCDQPLFSCDWLPMFVHAAGGTLPKDIVLDGLDPIATLAGTAPSPHQALFFQYRGYTAMRKGDYKLIRPGPNRPYELYDLRNDVGETTDLAKQKPDLVRAMRQELEHWLAETN